MTRIGRKLGVGVALAFAAVLFALVPAATAQTSPSGCGYGPCGPTLTLNEYTVHVGDTVTATLDHYVPNEIITITFGGITLGTVQADASGHATFTFTVPNVALGVHAVVGTGASGDSASANLNVVSGVSPAAVQSGSTASGSFAFTGANMWPTLFGGLAVLVGGLTLLATRKRSARS